MHTVCQIPGYGSGVVFASTIVHDDLVKLSSASCYAEDSLAP